MILTEKEAATKACVRSGGQGWAPGPMPDADTLPVWRCVGSRCMAWKWRGPKMVNGPLEQHVVTEGQRSYAQFRHTQVLNEARDGYCGLVGTP